LNEFADLLPEKARTERDLSWFSQHFKVKNLTKLYAPPSPHVFTDRLKVFWASAKASRDVSVLGRTVPSYRMKLENEIEGWKGLMKALPFNPDKEAFEELMNHCRRHAVAAGAAVRPIIIEAMFISILLEHEKELRMIKASLENLSLSLNETESQ